MNTDTRECVRVGVRHDVSLCEPFARARNAETTAADYRHYLLPQPPPPRDHGNLSACQTVSRGINFGRLGHRRPLLSSAVVVGRRQSAEGYLHRRRLRGGEPSSSSSSSGDGAPYHRVYATNGDESITIYTCIQRCSISWHDDRSNETREDKHITSVHCVYSDLPQVLSSPAPGNCAKRDPPFYVPYLYRYSRYINLAR